MIFGAVWVGGIVMRSLPHDQVLLFPIGSAFPNATRFSASWRQPNEAEARGGVTLTFDSAPPLQIREHANLPNGDYVVSVEVFAPSRTLANPGREDPPMIPQNTRVSPESRGVQTNIERRVTLIGGETLVALAAGGF